MSAVRKCGCKGIRTCLLCEKQWNVSVDLPKSVQVKYVYSYCPGCNLCWPDNEETASLGNFPLYLGELKLCQEFVSEEEEAAAISAIDKIPWMPSQSGRRKQDFGPKVNFKKKKVKIGEFKGFPKFTENVVRKFKDLPELADFQPVELCHLEYSPERGSAIDPHVDDFWLWGERLVTINLGSPTVLTLVPCSNDVCECHQKANCDSFQTLSLSNGQNKGHFSCSHKFQDLSESSLNCLSTNNITDGKDSNNYPEELKHDMENPQSVVGVENELSVSSIHMPKNNNSQNIQYPGDRISEKNSETFNGDNSSSCTTECSSEIPDSRFSEDLKLNYYSLQFSSDDIISLEAHPKSLMPTPTSCAKSADRVINTMCNVFRTGVGDFKAAVRIALPPRSLFVLAGCARYNWFHEIKRQDVVSRRLAMTFRELTAEFLDGGKENQLGKDLLQMANNFYDL